MSYPDFIKGTVFMFDCCCEGRKVIKFDGTKKEWVNQDDHFVGEKQKHPFLIVSPKDKNKIENYLTVLPITSHSKYDNPGKNEIRIEKEMVDTKGIILVDNNSYIKIDKITRIAKKNLTITKGKYPEYMGYFRDISLSPLLEQMKLAIQRE